MTSSSAMIGLTQRELGVAAAEQPGARSSHEGEGDRLQQAARGERASASQRGGVLARGSSAGRQRRGAARSDTDGI